MIVILDYDMGNHGSIINMLQYIGSDAVASADPDVLTRADKLILPGVGAFKAGMEELHKRELDQALHAAKTAGKIIFGICLGMQLLTKSSEEGSKDGVPGLALIGAETKRFSFENDKLKIPHMGWNRITPRENSLLFKHLDDDARFYFVHSYHAVCKDKSVQAATTTYGYDFCSAFEKDNVFATQFHPEKSHRHGMQVFRNFVAL